MATSTLSSTLAGEFAKIKGALGEHTLREMDSSRQMNSSAGFAAFLRRITDDLSELSKGSNEDQAVEALRETLTKFSTESFTFRHKLLKQLQSQLSELDRKMQASELKVYHTALPEDTAGKTGFQVEINGQAHNLTLCECVQRLLGEVNEIMCYSQRGVIKSGPNNVKRVKSVLEWVEAAAREAQLEEDLGAVQAAARKAQLEEDLALVRSALALVSALEAFENFKQSVVEAEGVADSLSPKNAEIFLLLSLIVPVIFLHEAVQNMNIFRESALTFSFVITVLCCFKFLVDQHKVWLELYRPPQGSSSPDSAQNISEAQQGRYEYHKKKQLEYCGYLVLFSLALLLPDLSPAEFNTETVYAPFSVGCLLLISVALMTSAVVGNQIKTAREDFSLQSSVSTVNTALLSDGQPDSSRRDEARMAHPA